VFICGPDIYYQENFFFSSGNKLTLGVRRHFPHNIPIPVEAQVAIFEKIFLSFMGIKASEENISGTKQIALRWSRDGYNESNAGWLPAGWRLAGGWQPF